MTTSCFQAIAPTGAFIAYNFLSDREHDELVTAIQKKLQRRRYEKDHFAAADAVIINYRETELELDRLIQGNMAHSALLRVRTTISQNFGPISRWLPPHVIDLREDDGCIRPHIDSVKFSGGIVAGLSLLSRCTMTLARADEKSGEVKPNADSHRLQLEPNSLYVLSGLARFLYAHSISETQGRRLSIIFRDGC